MYYIYIYILINYMYHTFHSSGFSTHVKKNEQPTSARITKQEQQNSDQKVSNITNSSTLDQSGVVYSFITIYLQVIIDHLLVAGFSPSEKHESQLVLLFPIYIYMYIWKVIKIMFQTTNQPQIVFPNGAQREGFTGKRDRDLRRDSTNTKSVHYYWFLLVDKQENTLEKNMLYTICLNPHLLEENRLPSPMSASMLGGG